MAEMDKVRFVAGDEFEDREVKVWQGFDAASSHMAGQTVYITAETARQMAEYEWEQIKDDEFMRLHNPPDGFWSVLAFGGDTSFGQSGARFAPDGVTPVYPLNWWTTTIVQRWNPEGGRTYDKVDIVDGVEKVVGKGHWGVWENVDTVVGIPDPVGFVVNPEDWADGRGDTPPFLRDDDEDNAEAETEVFTVTLVHEVEVRAVDDVLAKQIAAENAANGFYAESFAAEAEATSARPFPL